MKLSETYIARKIKERFDNYRLSVLLFLPISLIIMIAALAQGGFLVSDWFVSLVIIPSFIGRFISAASYFARLVDAWGVKKLPATEAHEAEYEIPTPFSKVKTRHPMGSKERWGTTLGLLFGLAVGIAAIALHASVAFLTPLSVVAYPIFIGGFIGIFAGLGNRIGVSLDGKNRIKIETFLMLAAAVLGFALGLALFLSPAAAVAIIPGVTPYIVHASFATWFAGMVFALITSSIFASAADYLAKSFCYIYSFFENQNQASTLFQLVKSKQYEYGGALLGTLLGIGMGLAVVLSMPAFFTGLAGAVGASIVILTCVGVVGGLVARSSRSFVDGFTSIESALSPKRRSVSDVTSSTSPIPSPVFVSEKDANEDNTIENDTAPLVVAPVIQGGAPA